MSPSNLVRDFVLRRCDEDAADYAASLVETEEDVFDASELREFLIEACGEGCEGEIDDLFASIERCRKQSDVSGALSSSPPPPLPPPPPPSSSAPLERKVELSPSALLRALELRSTKVEESELLADDEIGVGGVGRRRRKGSGGDDESDDDDDETTTTAEHETSISSLLELFPGRGRDYLSYALRINSGDVSEAASWLSSCSSSSSGSSSGGTNDNDNKDDNGESLWRAAREERRARRRAERAADEAARAKLLEKFDATAVVTSGEGSGGGGNAPIRLWGDDGKKKSSSKQQQQQQRYRDGIPVTSKGQKYIVVQDKEEWDGGSRGRVILKGKRGKGGVSLAK